MASGIYKITNKITKKFYIGSSYDIFTRWARHRSTKSPTCRKLFAAFNKYGVSNFLFEIIEDLPNKGRSYAEMKLTLLTREQYYLDTLQPFDNVGYNLSKIAGSTLGNKYPYRKTASTFCWSILSKQRISGKNGKHNVSVDQYDVHLNFIKNHYNITDAAKQFDTTIQSIIRCCQGKNKTAGLYVWAYANTTPHRVTPHKSKRVAMYSLQGSLIQTFTNAKRAAQYVDKSDNPIYKCCRGEQPTAHGYVWKWI